jgi:tetratricopeptide (TPR) repeat protein
VQAVLQAKGTGSRRQEPGVRPAKSSSESDAEEADVLAHYEAGEVNEALAQARKARLEPLASRIAAFASEETAGQKALAENDTAGALKHLSSAFALDEQLSHGWSVQGRELRKQLGNLHTAEGVQRQRAGDLKGARESFETALKFDSANAQAKAHLAELPASAAPVK